MWYEIFISEIAQGGCHRRQITKCLPAININLIDGEVGVDEGVVVVDEDIVVSKADEIVLIAIYHCIDIGVRASLEVKVILKIWIWSILLHGNQSIFYWLCRIVNICNRGDCMRKYRYIALAHPVII